MERSQVGWRLLWEQEIASSILAAPTIYPSSLAVRRGCIHGCVKAQVAQCKAGPHGSQAEVAEAFAF